MPTRPMTGFVALALLFACGTERGRPIGGNQNTTKASKRIVAADGGSVTFKGHKIDIPSQALAEDTVITVRTVAASAYPELADARSEVLILEPERTVLASPAAVTLALTAAANETVTIQQHVESWQPVEAAIANGVATIQVSTLTPFAATLVPADPKGTLQGTVMWSGGTTPADLAPVKLYFGDSLAAEVTTDSNGAFEITDLDPGSYHVRVDYECIAEADVSIIANETTTVSLVLCGS